VIRRLRTPEGSALLHAAAAAVHNAAADGGGLATTVTALRAAGHPPELVSAALTQVELRTRAVDKFGPDAASMFFTRDGLEQATRRVVADRRAHRLATALEGTPGRVADLCCGIGADALAMARAGLTVEAIDRDPVAVEVARANAAALNLENHLTVSLGDATTVDLRDRDAVFCDPARRSSDGRRVFDASDYSPSWPFLMRLIALVPRTVLKLGPGIDHARLPADAEAEWVSVAGGVVEATLWCGPLAQVPRRATVIDAHGQVAELTGPGTRQAPVGDVGRYLYDPDGAVIRARLVAELADQLGATLADPTIAYLYSDQAVPTRFARAYQILDVLPFGVKRLRAALRAAKVGRVTIKKRGSAVDPERLRRQLRLSGPEEVTVVLTRVAGAQTILLASPL